MNYAIGLDLGGTNIKALAVTAGGRVVAQTVVPTGDTGGRGPDRSSAWAGGGQVG